VEREKWCSGVVVLWTRPSDKRWILRPVWQHAHGTSQQRVPSSMPLQQRAVTKANWTAVVWRKARQGLGRKRRQMWESEGLVVTVSSKRSAGVRGGLWVLVWVVWVVCAHCARLGVLDPFPFSHRSS
jgi:hypothetical protein